MVGYRWRFTTSSRKKQLQMAAEIGGLRGVVGYIGATFVEVVGLTSGQAGYIARKYHVKLDRI